MSLRCNLSVTVLLLAAAFSFLGLVTPLMAQDTTVSVSVMIVAETLACRPAGYTNYQDDDAASQRCARLTATDFHDLRERHAHSDLIAIPPRRISLGGLTRPLNIYLGQISRQELSPAKRQSAVFLFEWNEPQTFDLTFQRLSKDPDIPSSTRPATYQMRNQRRWVYHTRADSVAPAFDVEWVLTMGDQELRLRTTQ